MDILHLLFQLFIEPLILLMEVLFRLSIKLTGEDVAMSIIPLSLAVNLLSLPLYMRADAIQQQNRALEQKMRPWLDHIKQAFHGDERFMMTQAYYRVCGYSPWFALRNSFSLLLQIPFFTAAYYMLSNTPYLDGVSLWPISNLSEPDGLIAIGGFSLNVLPLLMTAINVKSGMVYLKGTTSKSYKVQFYLLALIFLVLLYNSPAGLVFYWILNQLFSLGKNLVMARSEKKFTPVRRRKEKTKESRPLLGWLMGKNEESDKWVFLLGCLTMALLTGALIPSSVVYDSAVSFVTGDDYLSPFWRLLDSLLLATGALLLWPMVFYTLVGKTSKRLFEVLAWTVSMVMIANYMFFGRDLGNLNPFLIFDDNPVLLWPSVIRNTLTVAVLVIGLVIVWQEMRKSARAFQAIVTVVLAGMFCYNLPHIVSNLWQAEETASHALTQKPTFGFSRNGKNVVVVMLDRAVSSYIPYIFNENPELKQQFSGFTYYPNSLSFGAQTNTGAPGLYGGYEYIPQQMMSRDSVLLKDKHDEALRVMPVIFSRAGFDVTVTDPPYAGYSQSPDLSIYDDYPDIKAYKDFFKLVGDDEKKALWQRNFFRYSLMKVLPLCVQPWFYDKGFYQGTDPGLAVNTAQIVDNRSMAHGTDSYFMREKEALEALPEMSQCDDTEQNHFLLYYSCMAHSPSLLSEPDYEPEIVIDNREYDTAHEGRFTLNGRKAVMNDAKQMAHYHVNMASMMKFAKWFDYLKEQGVYDNTRIIIVSDHGYQLNSFADMVNMPTIDLMPFNALLLVKDFGSEGEMRTDLDFMTNADTPTLAFKDLIEDPVNPFTGNAVTDSAKWDKQRYILSSNWRTWVNNGMKYQANYWWIMQGYNFFDLNSWKYLGYSEK